MFQEYAVTFEQSAIPTVACAVSDPAQVAAKYVLKACPTYPSLGQFWQYRDLECCDIRTSQSWHIQAGEESEVATQERHDSINLRCILFLCRSDSLGQGCISDRRQSLIPAIRHWFRIRHQLFSSPGRSDRRFCSLLAPFFSP